MNPEYKQSWLEALRSGQYVQGTGQLCRNNEFCCLGVLADIITKRDEEVYWQPYFAEMLLLHTPYETVTSALPGQLLVTPGLTERQQVDLMRMNDDQGKSFSEIADYIEKNL